MCYASCGPGLYALNNVKGDAVTLRKPVGCVKCAGARRPGNAVELYGRPSSCQAVSHWHLHLYSYCSDTTVQSGTGTALHGC